MKKLLLALLLFGSFPAYIYCQTNTSSGYIITNSNDTLPGEVKFKKRLSAVSFSSGSKGSKQLYSPHQIKGFGYYGGKFYQPVSVPVEQGGKELVFANTLVSGKASLLKHESSYILLINDTSYHISVRSNTGGKDDHSAQKLNNRQLGIVNALLLSCSRKNPAPIDKITSELLTNSVIAYNECLGEPYIEHNTALPWHKVQVGAAVGASYSKINFSNYQGEYTFLPHAEFTSNVAPTIGLNLLISSPRVYHNLFLQVDVFLDKTQYEATYREKVSDTNSSQYNVLVNTTNVQVPITFRHTVFSKGPFSAYLRGGVVVGGHLKKELQLTKRYSVSNVNLYTKSYSHPEYLDGSFSYLGALGATRQVNKHFKGYLELSYDQMANNPMEKSSFRLVLGILY